MLVEQLCLRFERRRDFGEGRIEHVVQHILPEVIEPAAGATRATLAFLLGMLFVVPRLAGGDLRLSLAVKSARLGLWDWDTASTSIFFDEVFAGFVGRPELPRDVPTRVLMSITHPDDGARFNAQMLDLLRGRIESFEMEHRVRHTAGHWVWLHTSGNVTARDASGRALRVTGVIGDITPRKLLEAQLAAAPTTR